MTLSGNDGKLADCTKAPTICPKYTEKYTIAKINLLICKRNSRMKRQPTEREKYLPTTYLVRGQYPKHLTNSYNLISKKTNNPIPKRAKDLNDTFPKKTATCPTSV